MIIGTQDNFLDIFRFLASEMKTIEDMDILDTLKEEMVSEIFKSKAEDRKRKKH